MPANSKKQSKGRRSYDQESGMNRTQRGKARSQPIEPVESSEDEQTTDSEAEQLAQAVTRDDSVRIVRKVKPRKATRGAPVQPNADAQEADEDDVEEVRRPEVQTSSHFTFLVAMARQIAPQPITFPTVSTFYPDCGNMFMTIYYMTRAISDNLKLFELSGDYTSTGLALYYSHVFFYHILRVRNDSGQLTRLERRSLRLYETVGKPESWPIATPLIGFIQALGFVEVPDKMFSLIVPKLPDFSKFTAKKGLTGLHTVTGMGRFPIPPAYQEFLRRFGADESFYDDDTDTYYPAETPLSAGKQSTTFIGITDSSAANNDFQALALNQGWNTASETNEPVGQFSTGGRQVRVKRWSIPKVEDTADFTAMESFLFGSGEHLEWMRKLLKISSIVNKHFPGSSNLGAIPTLTTIYTHVETSYKAKTSRTVVKDHWYYNRHLWSVNFKSNFFGPEVNTHIQAAVAVSVNSSFDNTVIPTGYDSSFGHGRDGPYFVEATGERSVPVPQSEGQGLHDPTQRIEELINSVMYNAQGE